MAKRECNNIAAYNVMVGLYAHGVSHQLASSEDRCRHGAVLQMNEMHSLWLGTHI